ncbi:MAG: RND family transporter [Tenuifilaceae bacterium]
MFQFIARIILRYRLLLLIIIGLFTLFMAYMATFVELSYKPTTLLPKEDSVLIRNLEFVKKFGKGENIMVVGVQTPEFFSYEHFNNWKKLEIDLKSINGVEQTFSLINAINLVKDTTTKKFAAEKIFAEKDLSLKELDSLAQVASSLRFYKGLLYNDSTKTYLMLITLNREMITKKERVGLVNEIVTVCKTYEENTNNKLYYSGLPYIRVTVGEMIKGEMYLFVCLAVIVTSIILLLLFRSFRIVLMSLLVVGIGVIWSLGTLTLFGFDLTLLTAVVPTLLVVIGVPSCIFLINKYHHEYRHHGNKIKALHRVITKVGSATFLSNLTTAIGFGAFIITNTQILKEFGIVASINVMGVYALSLMLIPIIFSFSAPPDTKHLTHLSRRGIKKNIYRIVLSVLYRRKVVFTIASVLVVVGLIGVTLLKNNGFMVDDIPRNHPVLINLKFFEKNFNGVMPFEIVYDTKKPNGYLSASTLNKIDRLQEKLSHYPELSKPVSIVEAAKFASQAYYNGHEDRYRLPSTFEWGFILSYIPRSIGISDLFARMVDSTGRYVRIMYNADDIGTIRMKELTSKVRADIDSVFKDNSKQVIVTGSSIVAARGNDYLVESLLVSLPLAVCLISIFMAWMFRKWRIVMFSVLTNLFPLLLTSAAMGYLGITLKPSTVIVFSIAFGIAIDNSIQLLAKYRQELKRTSHNIKASVIYAIRETGISVIYTSVVLFFGFGVFSLSKFGGTVSLGVLVSLTLLIALFSNLFILPSILLSFERSTSVDPEYEPALELSAGFDEDDETENSIIVEEGELLKDKDSKLL